MLASGFIVTGIHAREFCLFILKTFHSVAACDCRSLWCHLCCTTNTS